MKRPAPGSLPASLDCYVGCLVGGAVGDALGAPVEFLSRAAIVEQFGTRGIRDFAPAYGIVGAITDDTQMTLFTAEGLLDAQRSVDDHSSESSSDRRDRVDTQAGRSGSSIVSPSAERGHPVAAPGALSRALGLAYQRWLATQGEPRASDGAADGDGSCGLLHQPALHARRGPGSTCLMALTATRTPGMPARNDSKGCGGVMRAAPAGLFADALGLGDDRAFDIGVASAALTHGHPTGQLTAGALALIVARLCAGAALADAVGAAMARLRREPHHDETLDAMEHALRLAAAGGDRADAIARLGEGWVAEEALAIALYCASVAGDFADGVTLAVNHDGDSDSTGSIAGNLLGTMLGVSAISARWREGVELSGVIAEVAVQLHGLGRLAAAGTDASP